MSENGFVKITDLRKTYQLGETEVHALAGINLNLTRGSFNVVMGPSGSGKSTLLYLLGGLDWPTSGAIEVDGEAVAGMDENDLAVYRRTRIGFIFQAFNLVGSMTALENVAFPLRFAGITPAERQKRALEVLEQVGLADRVQHKPIELSGGQQQRVAIARALINNPSLILADEPTGNLDSVSGYAIMQLLSQLHQAGKTILVATHDPRMLTFASNVIYLMDGIVVSEQDYQESIQQPIIQQGGRL